MKKNRSQLKTALMEAFDRAVEEVLDWQEAHETFTLTELEELGLQVRQEVGVEIAGLLLGQLASPPLLEGLCCEQCGSPLRYKGDQARYVETRLGGLEIERERYWCPTCQAGFFPLGQSCATDR
jgi:hypothetical protein